MITHSLKRNKVTGPLIYLVNFFKTIKIIKRVSRERIEILKVLKLVNKTEIRKLKGVVEETNNNNNIWVVLDSRSSCTRARQLVG